MYFHSCSGYSVGLDRLSCSIATLGFCSGSRCGPKSRMSIAARRLAGDAPRLSLRLPSHQPRHSGRCRHRRHQPRRHRQIAQPIRSTVPSTQRTRGQIPRKSGVAMCTTAVVCCHPSRFRCLRCLRHLQIPTIAQTVLQTGRPAGVWARRVGAAKCMAKVAPARATDAQQSPGRWPLNTIAMQVSQIGWWVGQFQRKHGAARTLARAAHQQPEVARERVTT